MNDKLLTILRRLSSDEILVQKSFLEINEIFGIKQNVLKENNPKLVGYLIKQFGYNGFHPIVKGAPVYELNDRYFFEMKSITSSEIVRQNFYKETLKPVISFL